MIAPQLAANPVILMMKNTQINTYHPIMYWECPPNSMPIGSKVRWKSKAHHTSGFLNREDAVEAAKKLCQHNQDELALGNVYYDLNEENDIEWDGDGIPADTQCFDLDKLTLYSPNIS